jgi:hypothetical protein
MAPLRNNEKGCMGKRFEEEQKTARERAEE